MPGQRNKIRCCGSFGIAFLVAEHLGLMYLVDLCATACYGPLDPSSHQTPRITVHISGLLKRIAVVCTHGWSKAHDSKESTTYISTCLRIFQAPFSRCCQHALAASDGQSSVVTLITGVHWCMLPGCTIYPAVSIDFETKYANSLQMSSPSRTVRAMQLEPSRPAKYRASCDNCARPKARCIGGRPKCKCCAEKGASCDCSPAQRSHRPRSQKSQMPAASRMSATKEHL